VPATRCNSELDIAGEPGSLSAFGPPLGYNVAAYEFADFAFYFRWVVRQRVLENLNCCHDELPRNGA